jgi:hypothetical protein
MPTVLGSRADVHIDTPLNLERKKELGITGHAGPHIEPCASPTVRSRGAHTRRCRAKHQLGPARWPHKGPKHLWIGAGAAVPASKAPNLLLHLPDRHAIRPNGTETTHRDHTETTHTCHTQVLKALIYTGGVKPQSAHVQTSPDAQGYNRACGLRRGPRPDGRTADKPVSTALHCGFRWPVTCIASPTSPCIERQ